MKPPDRFFVLTLSGTMDDLIVSFYTTEEDAIEEVKRYNANTGDFATLLRTLSRIYHRDIDAAVCWIIVEVEAGVPVHTTIHELV